MKLCKNTVLFCVLWCFLSMSSQVFSAESSPKTDADMFKILHHQRLSNLEFTQPAATQKSDIAAKASAATVLSLDAYGQHFELELKPNDELIDKLPMKQKKRLKQSMQIYKGKIPGIAGSWARINKHGKRISGAFWDGNELYMIDSFDEVGKALDDNKTKASRKLYTVIYKSSNIQTTATCGVAPGEKALSTYKALVDELRSKAQALPLASKQLNVAIVADAQFTQTNSTNPQAAVISRMNVVDGIYSDQVGVHINIAEICALATNGSLSSTDADTLLDQFEAYTASGFNNPGLAHLFTGRNMDGSTIGVAYIGVLCRKDLGIGLSETTGTGTAGALTVAHEMGHNFGAPHDNERRV